MTRLEQFASKEALPKKPTSREPKVVDLFSGAGGFSLGARNAGAQVAFAVEFDKFAAATYRNNLCRDGKTTLYTEDIVELDANALAEKHFPNGSECDILLGGPPCQGFSTHRINNAGVNDPRNTLIYRYFDFVRALRPRAFLLENVPGLLWPRHKEYLEKFYQLAADEGYTVFAPSTLDARNFGVPQRRKRVFILGICKRRLTPSLNWPLKPSHSETSQDPEKKWISCQDAFLPATLGDPNDLHMNHNEELIGAFKNTPPNGGSRRDSGRTLPCHKNHDGHKDVYGRIDPRVPAPTMTTACINPSKGRFVHPTEHHGITVRQAARLQTFPDDFVFEGGLTAAGKQIGNAVPVKMAEALINHLVSMVCPVTEPACLPVHNEQKS
ncbi:DNA cytosine methyltransferase [Pseudooceanicola spongiae]|uniref:Cytosine-specific methyltransferase n=1 Tax=Pseudooceanicola spongiae TaxID=2613965 RepID=A0A7L9WUM2_9RHOB|nr:DNA cytosine methyltransferase [Pseudooceanicola spongiae]QOL82790.1 DNA (cytosine-5-)-methyltransferase [Pseudooceanicola spongiae]